MRNTAFKAYGEVYNVKERMEDSGVSGEWDDYPDWYEYEMFLQAPDGRVIAEWDSLLETYNGVQKLSKAEAESAVKEIVEDVKKGRAENWFTVPSSFKERAVKITRKSAKKHSSRNVPTGLSGMKSR